MAEYTYEDIIIDPTSEEAKNAVGKICYFSDSPRTLLSEIDCKRPVEGILTNMEDGYFEVDNKGYWDCIIVKKEEPKPKYVPFENQKEFARAYQKFKESLKYGTFEYDLGVCGIWLKHNDAFLLVVEIWDRGVVIGDINMQTTEIEEDEYLTVHGVTKWKELLEDYTFLDGSPCGKLVEESNA